MMRTAAAALPLRTSALLRAMPRTTAPIAVRTFASEADLFKTALHAEHVRLGGKMVPFAGYSLPVQYKDSMINSHLHCRKSASLFDVSHMGQLRIWGAKRIEFLESLIVGDLLALSTNQARLTVLTNDQGGIIDDCMVTRKDDHLYMVINAGCKDKDIKHLREQLALFNQKHNADVRIEEFSKGWELVALQGPKAASVLSRLIPSSVDLSKLPFMFQVQTTVAGIGCIVTRCGYTGEDGFEISIPVDQTLKVWSALLEHQEVLPAGLGVRDTLRMEAGLCLYGHEITDETSPIEATLAWLITKRRREQGGFKGFDVISRHLKEGVTRKRVGLFVKGPPARENCPITDESGAQVGITTSGTFSPCLNRPISIAYVSTPLSKLGTKVQVSIRDRKYEAEVTKMPFVPSNYFKPATA